MKPGRPELLQGNALILNASILGAQLAQNVSLFRQRDVRFFYSLFCSWMATGTQRDQEDRLHNTQIMRYLDELVKERWATLLLPRRRPTYRLTRAGVLGLLEKIRTEIQTNRDFLFVQYFFRSYAEIFAQSAISESAMMSRTLKQEIAEIMDLKELKRGRLRSVEKELEYWEARVADIESMVSFAKDLDRNGESWPTILKTIEARFPYELNAQRSLTQLMSGLTKDHQRWEIFFGNAMRIQHLWLPHMQMLETERKWLSEELDG